MVYSWWWISAPLIGILALRWYIRRTKSCPSHMRLDDHTVIVTGASNGIGKATALELARRGGRVILACRSRAKTEPIVKQIIKETGNRNVEFRQVDLACQRSIRDFAREFNEQEQRLDVLINNAGYEGPKRKTENGHEMTFGVNHLGHFLLTKLLLPKLQVSSPSRVVIVTSDSYAQGRLDLDNLANDGYPDVFMAYARSKLANIYFTSELHRIYSKEGIAVFAVHPGATATGLFRDFPGVVGFGLRIIGKFLFRSPEQGSQTVVFCAVARGIERHSGKLFSDCHTRELTPHVIDALNRGDGEKLWRISEDLCRDYLTAADDKRRESENEAVTSPVAYQPVDDVDDQDGIADENEDCSKRDVSAAIDDKEGADNVPESNETSDMPECDTSVVVSQDVDEANACDLREETKDVSAESNEVSTESGTAGEIKCEIKDQRNEMENDTTVFKLSDAESIPSKVLKAET